MKNEMVTYTVMKNYVMGNWELTFISLTDLGLAVSIKFVLDAENANTQKKSLIKNDHNMLVTNIFLLVMNIIRIVTTIPLIADARMTIIHIRS